MPRKPARRETRVVIVHHHIFKCAGTSLDTILEASFPGRLSAAEPRTREDAQEWIRQTPECVAYTSHHAPLGLALDGVTILPALFLREPFTRIVSAYGFERRQGEAGHTGRGARLAAHHDFAGWLEQRLDTPGDRQVSELQSTRLATLFDAAEPDPARAIDAFAALPFVGLVEAFSPSIAALAACAAQHGLRLAIRTPSAHALGYGETAAEALASLPAALRERLIAANRYDVALHRTVAQRYGIAADSPVAA